MFELNECQPCTVPLQTSDSSEIYSLVQNKQAVCALLIDSRDLMLKE